MGISEEDGILYGYSIKLYDEEYLLSLIKAKSFQQENSSLRTIFTEQLKIRPFSDRDLFISPAYRCVISGICQSWFSAPGKSFSQALAFSRLKLVTLRPSMQSHSSRMLC